MTLCRIVLVLLCAGPALAQSEDAKKLFQQGQELVKEQKFDEAIVALKKAIEAEPRNDLYIATLSDAAFKAGRYAEGLEHALLAVKLNDKAGPYHVLVAANALGNQDIDKARATCEAVLKRGREFGSGPVNDARALLEMLVGKTYTLTWNLNPQNGRAVMGRYAVALPKTNLPYQTVTYEVEGGTHQLVKGEVNDVLYLTPKGGEKLVLTTKVETQPYSFKKDIASATPKPPPADIRVYLGPSDTINVNSPMLKKLAASLKGKDSMTTARNILGWMKKNIEYKLEKKSITELDFKSVDEIIERKHAECRGYAVLFTALCRAAEVPARPIWGVACVYETGNRQAGKLVSHNWAEIYVNGVGWVPVDPQKPESLGLLPTSCIRIFMDARKTRQAPEILPMLNLLYMVGDKLEFKEMPR